MSDSSFWCNLQQSSFLAFTDEGVAVWQPLAGEDVAFGLVPEHGVTLLVHLKHAIAWNLTRKVCGADFEMTRILFQRRRQSVFTSGAVNSQ